MDGKAPASWCVWDERWHHLCFSPAPVLTSTGTEALPRGHWSTVYNPISIPADFLPLSLTLQMSLGQRTAQFRGCFPKTMIGRMHLA